MGTMGDHDTKTSCGCEKNLPVMVFVEMQTFGRTYNEAEGLFRGTLFPALDKPFTGRGGCKA
ncbi:MAG: spore coat associated protein CotJA [Clostridia bacterium]|nr:spore coat associated protein CotJA [Clostridia bacterium]